jgi:rhodanese-related sulfurtransferase
MKFRSLFSLVVAIAILSCNGQTSKEIKTISAPAFAEKINATANPQILDVRTPAEFESEHIKNAANVDWLGDHFVAGAAKYDKSKPVFVYCKSGGRSKKAAEKLHELGFKNIYELDGGFLKWDATGLSKPTDNYRIITGIQRTIKYMRLINFYAEWCAPCKKMAPYVTKMQTELADQVVIIRLNADENKTLMSEMNIEELPTLILYENKEVKWKHSGFISEEDLKKQL